MGERKQFGDGRKNSPGSSPRVWSFGTQDVDPCFPTHFLGPRDRMMGSQGRGEKSSPNSGKTFPHTHFLGPGQDDGIPSKREKVLPEFGEDFYQRGSRFRIFEIPE
jgi:hypothetical protein